MWERWPLVQYWQWVYWRKHPIFPNINMISDGSIASEWGESTDLIGLIITYHLINVCHSKPHGPQALEGDATIISALDYQPVDYIQPGYKKNCNRSGTLCQMLTVVGTGYTYTSIRNAHRREDTAWRHGIGRGLHGIFLPFPILQSLPYSTICFRSAIPKPFVVGSGVFKKLAIASPKTQRVAPCLDQVTFKMHKHLTRLNNATTIPDFHQNRSDQHCECIRTH